MSEPVNVDVKLGVNKFHVDEGHPHIVIREHPDMAAFRLLTLACPAGLYKQLEDGGIRFDYAGWNAAPVAFCAATRCWKSGFTHAVPSAWSIDTANAAAAESVVSASALFNVAFRRHSYR